MTSLRLRSLLLGAVLIMTLVFLPGALAVSETTVHDACGFGFPATATITSSDGSTTGLNGAEIYALTGLVRPTTKGNYVGTVTVSDGSNVRTFAIYSYGGVARPWSIFCNDTGVNMRVDSDYLDCRLAGECQ